MLDRVDNAIYDLIHGAPGGAVGLAHVLGMNPGTLNHKANPKMKDHHLTVKEAVRIQVARQTASLLQVEAAELNHVCIPLGDYSGVSDIELLASYAAWHAEIGETAQAISSAITDRKMSRANFEHVRKEIFEDIQKGFEFLSRLEAVIDE